MKRRRYDQEVNLPGSVQKGSGNMPTGLLSKKGYRQTKQQPVGFLVKFTLEI